MSEPVYHDLSIFNTVNSTPAVEWVTARLEETRCYEFSITHLPYWKPESLSFLHFVTPWEPQLALILEASRQFPDTQFGLGFTGSAGTTLEDGVDFTIRDGAILTFESSPRTTWGTDSYDGTSLDKIFFDVLDYCGQNAGGPPFLRGVMALCLDKGMHVQDANGREVTHDSLAVDELTPRPQWAGISPQDFAKTVMMYRVPTRQRVEAYKNKKETQ